MHDHLKVKLVSSIQAAVVNVYLLMRMLISLQ